MARRSLGVAVIGALMAPAMLQAQLRQTTSPINKAPHKDAKLVMITVFDSPPPAPNERGPRLGVQAAEEMRKKVEGEFNDREVFVIPGDRINQQLISSGFDTTAALLIHDSKTLASTVRADEYLRGSVARTPSGGYRAKVDLILTRDINARQPLGVGEAPKLGDALKIVAQEMKEARKQLPGERNCSAAGREQKYPQAIEFANAAIALYPKATLARMCLVSALYSSKAPNTEIAKVARELVALDPNSNVGLKYLVEVYRADKQTDSLVGVLTQMIANDSTNTELVNSAIDEIASAKNPALALPLLDKAIAQNQGDPSLLKKRWQILFSVQRYKEMVETGSQMVRLEASLADTVYYQRTAVAFAADSQWKPAAALLAEGVAKYPMDALLVGLEIQALKNAGEPQQALDKLNAAMARKVPIPRGGAIVCDLMVELRKPPAEIVAAARQFIAAGDTTTSIRQIVINQANALYSSASKAQAAQQPEVAGPLFLESLAVLSYADSVVTRAQRPQVFFLKGVAGIVYAGLKFNEALGARSCPLAKESQSYVVDGQIDLTKGGSPTNGAQMNALMGMAGQIQPNIEQLMKSIPNCK